MTQRHSVTWWLGVILALVGLQGATSTQTPLAETRQQADQGDAIAQFDLGWMYFWGLGDLPQDFTQAVTWWRRAAAQGQASAQYNLGLMYRDGRGVPQDFTQAMAWYRKAADQGSAVAQYNLGVMYRDGRGVPQDYVEAHKWHDLAASRITGDTREEYAETRDALAEEMTPAQLAEAQRLARDWQAAFEKR